MQREQLSDFLRSCRARLSPAQVGLPNANRRRTPGLRREDVAALASVSVTWYTWLEQGRNIRVSAAVLERIAETLKLTADEREYLFRLAHHRPAPLVVEQSGEVPEALRRMVTALSVPAIVMTSRWDIVAWNALAAHVFGGDSELVPGQRNLLKILLTDPEYQVDAAQYEVVARRAVAKLRIDYSHAAGDPAFEALIEELSASCALFRRLWAGANEGSRRDCIDVVRHFQAVVCHVRERMTLEHTSYVPEDSQGLRLLIAVPHDEESAQRLARAASVRSPDHRSADAPQPQLRSVGD